MIDRDGPRIALACFGLDADAVEPLAGGAVNTHWRVHAGSQLYVLRRYNPRHDPAGTPFEHEALRHLARRGWPVAPALPATDGRTVVEIDGGRYTLFPFLPGRPAPARNPIMLERKGRLLARLHRDLAAWAAPAQRPGFARVTELDVWITPDGFATVEELLSRAPRDEAALVTALHRELAASREELDRLGYTRLPEQPIHFEFYGANLLFEGGALSGLLDFDFVHLDTRIADIGRGIVLDCAASDGGIDPSSLAAFLGGYLAESRLDDPELGLMVPLLRVNLLWLAALPLSLWAAGDPAAYLLPSARHTAAVRLPRLRSRQAELEAAVMAATSGGGRRPSR